MWIWFSIIGKLRCVCVFVLLLYTAYEWTHIEFIHPFIRCGLNSGARILFFFLQKVVETNKLCCCVFVCNVCMCLKQCTICYSHTICMFAFFLICCYCFHLVCFTSLFPQFTWKQHRYLIAFHRCCCCCSYFSLTNINNKLYKQYKHTHSKILYRIIKILCILNLCESMKSVSAWEHGFNFFMTH